MADTGSVGFGAQTLRRGRWRCSRDWQDGRQWSRARPAASGTAMCQRLADESARVVVADVDGAATADPGDGGGGRLHAGGGQDDHLVPRFGVDETVTAVVATGHHDGQDVILGGAVLAAVLAASFAGAGGGRGAVVTHDRVDRLVDPAPGLGEPAVARGGQPLQANRESSADRCETSSRARAVEAHRSRHPQSTSRPWEPILGSPLRLSNRPFHCLERNVRNPRWRHLPPRRDAVRRCAGYFGRVTRRARRDSRNSLVAAADNGRAGGSRQAPAVGRPAAGPGTRRCEVGRPPVWSGAEPGNSPSALPREVSCRHQWQRRQSTSWNACRAPFSAATSTPPWR